MESTIWALVVTLLVPLMAVIWNRQRVKGKLLCFITRKDKSVIIALCKLRSDFVIYEDRAYEVYPDYVRLTRFPVGWPAALQELVPTALYDEEDAVPLDWVNIDKRLERSMELRAALDENWLKKLVHEASAEGGFSFNFRKILPMLLIGLGLLGLVFILMRRGII